MVQREVNALKKQTKVKAEIKTEKAFYTEMKNLDEQALEMALELGIFTDAEMNIIKMRLDGFQKKEIDLQLSKRTDRDFKRIEKKYRDAV
ncbi:hypothetical protein D3C86_2117940 [compost metagenome]